MGFPNDGPVSLLYGKFLLIENKFSEDKRYSREVLIFNMCFIVAKQTQCDWVYESLVQKCAEYLVELEKVKLLIFLF